MRKKPAYYPKCAMLSICRCLVLVIDKRPGGFLFWFYFLLDETQRIISNFVLATQGNTK